MRRTALALALATLAACPRATPKPTPTPTELTREDRLAFAQLEAQRDAAVPKLIELADTATNGRDRQVRRDAILDFERERGRWVQGTSKAWHNGVVPRTTSSRMPLGPSSLELIGDEVVEQKILSSRLALAVREKASWELNDLKLRMQHLELIDDLDGADILQPEAVAHALIEQWAFSDLPRESWTLAKDVIQQHMVERLLEGYTAPISS